MDKQLTNAELAVLGLIVERSLHGYEIEAVIQERGMRNWTEIGFSSIYRVLGLLEREALIDSRQEKAPGKGPARKVYSATSQGRERYREEAVEALSKARRTYPAFLQGLAALPEIGETETARALRSYKLGLAERLEEVKAKDLPGIPFHVAAMFSYSAAMIGAELAWVSGFEARLRDEAAEGGEG